VLPRCAACGLPTGFLVNDPFEQFTPQTLPLAKGFRPGGSRVRRRGKEAILMADHRYCSNLLGGDRPSPHRLISPEDGIALQQLLSACRDRHNR